MFITIPVGMIIGFILGWWAKAAWLQTKDQEYEEIVRDIKDARRAGYEYVNGRWQKKGV